MRYVLIIIMIIGFISLIFFLKSIHIPNPNDLQLSSNSKIYAGYKEICIDSNSQTQCLEGLECKPITKIPEVNGICLKPEEEYKEDYYDWNNTIPNNKINLTDMFN